MTNALHPFFAGDDTIADVMTEAGSSALWLPVHIGVGLAVILLTVATVMVARHLRHTPGEPYANIAAILAIVGGTMFTVDVVAIDGFAFERLGAAAGAEQFAPAAIAMGNIEAGVFALVVFVHFGLMFVAFGEALDKANAFAGWIRWTSTIAGITGIIVGLLLLLDTATEFAFLAFRVVALAVTAVAIGIGVALRKGPQVIDVSTDATAGATTTPA